MKNIKREDLFRYMLAIVTAILLAIASLVYPQSPLMVAPLFVSLVVMFLQSSANRYGYLLGGLNSVLYAVAYLLMGIYGQVFQSLCFSFPLQIWTFLRWKKNAYKNSTVFKRLSSKQFLLLLGICIVGCFGGVLVLNSLGSSNSVLDTIVTVLGIVVTILALLSYVEYTTINLVSCTLTIVLHILIMRENPAQITYVIYSVYALICVGLGFLHTRKLYREQRIAASESETDTVSAERA